MKKIFCSLFVAFFAISSARAIEGGCEVFANHTESQELIFIQDSDPAGCPSGYVETTEYDFVPDSASCGGGYVDVSAEFKEIVECDSTRGRCTNTFVCIVP